MENLNTSIESQSATKRLPLVSRIARQLVFRQLAGLSKGKLVVREPGVGEQVFGDGDGRYPVAELVVHNHGTWRDLVTGGSIGAAEAFVAGDWSSPDLTALLRFFSRNLDTMNAFEDKFSWVSKPALKGLH